MFNTLRACLTSYRNKPFSPTSKLFNFSKVCFVCCAALCRTSGVKVRHCFDLDGLSFIGGKILPCGAVWCRTVLCRAVLNSNDARVKFEILLLSDIFFCKNKCNVMINICSSSDSFGCCMQAWVSCSTVRLKSLLEVAPGRP